MNANTVKDDLLLTAAGVEIEAAGKDARPKISVVAYTGRIMRVPGWGDIAIDLAGLEAGGRVPLLTSGGHCHASSMKLDTLHRCIWLHHAAKPFGAAGATVMSSPPASRSA